MFSLTYCSGMTSFSMISAGCVGFMGCKSRLIASYFDQGENRPIKAVCTRLYLSYLRAFCSLAESCSLLRRKPCTQWTIWLNWSLKCGSFALHHLESTSTPAFFLGWVTQKDAYLGQDITKTNMLPLISVTFAAFTAWMCLLFDELSTI
jgi:hypothetical protein